MSPENQATYGWLFLWTNEHQLSAGMATSGNKPGSNTWLSIRCVSCAFAMDESSLARWLTTSNRTKAMPVCSGHGLTGRPYAQRTTPGLNNVWRSLV